MIWTLLWGTVAGIGAMMICVVTIYWYEFGMVQVTRGLRHRTVRPRLWFHAEQLGTKLFAQLDRVPDGLGPGIDGIYGDGPHGRRRLQSILFDSATWRSRDAVEWLRRNRYDTTRILHVRR